TSATGGAAGGEGGGAPLVTTRPLVTYDHGWFVAGPLSGYAWLNRFDDPDLGLTSTIEPSSVESFSRVEAGGRLCASGTVAADYASGAMIGLNLAQVPITGELGTWTPVGDGLVVTVDNPGGSPVRVQIQPPGAGSDTSAWWCANLTRFGEPVFIPWSDFVTECWGGDETPYAGQPLEALVLVVPGEPAGEIEFDFCLDDLRVAGVEQPTACFAEVAQHPCYGDGACMGVARCASSGNWASCACENQGWALGCPSARPSPGSDCSPLREETEKDTFCPFADGGCVCGAGSTWDCPAGAASFAYNGYWESSRWRGYVFDFGVSATVDPPCGDTGDCFEDAGVVHCATGTLDAAGGMEAVVGLGVDLNRSRDGTMSEAWTPVGTGLRVWATGVHASDMVPSLERVQLRLLGRLRGGLR
ncbi:MAG TPA: hypothetical protein PLU22_12155, partial [Polyangiaceae bacterium]|nr:hypothetical protein [Polyangiaceae bacterium]